MSGVKLGSGAVAVAVLLYSLAPDRTIPVHLRNDAITLPDLIDEVSYQELRALVREFGLEGFPVNTNDLKSYRTEHEHIGEAEVMPPDGRCSDVYKVPSVNRSLCILPGRIDIGRHYITTGGLEGLKEGASDLTARALSFGRYMFDLSAYPVVERLFNSERFQDAARKICPSTANFLDPFQFNFIIQVPGQSVPMHVDGVYFWGATRFQFPQWLLATMLWSGVFQDAFVHQVQVVGYLHDSYDAQRSGGEFAWWGSDGKLKRSSPSPRSGTAVDGSKTVHAAAAYLPGAGAPPISKDDDTLLVNVGDSKWEIRAARAGSGEGPVGVRSYNESDLRMSIVYRARCFRDAEQAQQFRDLLHAPPETPGRMRLEDILTKLREDLAARGKPVSDDASRYDLALKLVGEYVRYPFPSDALVPLNFCALGGLVPSMRPLLRPFCSSV